MCFAGDYVLSVTGSHDGSGLLLRRRRASALGCEERHSVLYVAGA